MSKNPKIAFELIKYDDTLHVRATSPFGEAKADVEDTSALDTILVDLENENLYEIPSSRIQQIGNRLYKTLFAGKIAELGQHVFYEGISQKLPTQFEIRLDADQVRLARFPWEMIADDFGRPVVRDGLVDLTRYITFPQPPPQINIDLEDPLLRVISSPKNLARITALDIPLSHLLTLDHATYNLFVQNVLIEKLKLWGIHFDGHGAMLFQCLRCNHLNFSPRTYCAKCGKELKGQKEVGALAFEAEGAAEWVLADEIGAVLFNADIQFALLLACESANLGGQFLFNGLAPNLILAGVPAVVGMQFPVSDNYANHFMRIFYTTILQGKDILGALRVARQASVKDAWYSPVLYLRHREDDRSEKPVYHTRQVDTATPASVKPGVPFLAKLWIRRPESPPATSDRLREELGIEGDLATHNTEADIKFENIAGRSLRRGNVEIHLDSPFCEIAPASIPLFISEHLDAPPAMFRVTPRRLGKIPLNFSLWQDEMEIASIIHSINCSDTESLNTSRNTLSIPVEETPVISISQSDLESDELDEEIILIDSQDVIDLTNDRQDERLEVGGSGREIIKTSSPEKIKVIVTDWAGGKTMTAELPADVQMKRLIPALVTRMSLPTNVQYDVQHKQSGRILQPNNTLGSIGVKEGNTLRLIPNVVAGCFLGRTKVSIPNDRQANIEDLKEGDVVLGYDLENHQLVESTIKRVYKFFSDEYFVINHILNVTGSHPIYASKTWTTVAELHSGDYLYDEKLQPIEIFDIIRVKENVRVYNLELLDTHVFFADGILVHNVSIKVTVTDQDGGKTVTAELPADAQMDRLVPALVTKMSLPRNVQYGIQHKQSGKQLQPRDTLEKAGVKEGDTLRMLPNVTAGCFLGGTEISLSNGKSTKIEYLREGDKILAYDLEKNEVVESEVKQVYRFTTQEYYIIDYKLGITASHPIYANGKWTTPDKLNIGDHLYDERMNEVQIYDIVKINQKARIYNLELAQNHAFFADGVLVHNVHIDVAIYDPRSGKSIKVNLPSGVDTENFISSLIKELELPDNTYILYSKSAGGEIDLHKSLFKVGIKNGNELQIVSHH